VLRAKNCHFFRQSDRLVSFGLQESGGGLQFARGDFGEKCFYQPFYRKFLRFCLSQATETALSHFLRCHSQLRKDKQTRFFFMQSASLRASKSLHDANTSTEKRTTPYFGGDFPNGLSPC
jgi:hypothetical protein